MEAKGSTLKSTVLVLHHGDSNQDSWEHPPPTRGKPTPFSQPGSSGSCSFIMRAAHMPYSEAYWRVPLPAAQSPTLLGQLPTSWKCSHSPLAHSLLRIHTANCLDSVEARIRYIQRCAAEPGPQNHRLQGINYIWPPQQLSATWWTEHHGYQSDTCILIQTSWKPHCMSLDLDFSE